MFSEKLSGVYTAMEEKYYGLLDFLDEKGVPVYAYNDFLEGKGLPAFPVTVALIVLLLAAVYGIFFVGGSLNPEITIKFSDQFNDSVSGVTVSAKDSYGRVLAGPKKLSSGGTLMLEGIPLGSEVVIVAEKHGFETAEQALPITKQSISTSISMERQVSIIAGELQFVDSETGDPVRGALVTAEWKGTTKSETTDSEGKAGLAGIPESIDILVTVQADGYETVAGNYSFLEGELKEISLVASSISLSAMSRIVVSVLDEEGSPVNGAKIIAWDRETDTSIEERTIEESEAIFSIAKATSVRLIVQKEGFLRYDSLDFDESRTLRQDEEHWPVVLLKGGTRLIVTAFVGQTPLSDATIQLFDLNNNLIDYDITGFGGTAEFSSLEPKEIFATAYKQGFLPAREKVNIAGTETVSIVLEPADSTNSSYLGISVLDSYKAMANNADLLFAEKMAGQVLPIGIPQLKTDVSGYASIVAKTGTLVTVEAKKDLQTGFGEKLVEANKDNQLVIELSKQIDVIELQVLDQAGNAAQGRVVIESVAGELLFDGPLSEGRVFFDGEGNKDAIVRVETLEGETFSQMASIEGKETVQVKLGEAALGIAPTIIFTGIQNELGEEVEGISPGKDYWLSFQTSWPSGVEKGGVHIRLGLDGIAFADSQEAGITGFEATTTDYFYGKSFQPLPAPGNETADRQNIGEPDQMNKLLELYFEQPENTISLKARVRAADLVSAERFDLHYRAWSEAGGRFFRSPQDLELGEEMFSTTKTALYAEAEKAEVKVFASDATCEEDLCGNYFFVMPNGLYIDRQDFKAVAGELYALEIDLSAKKPMSLTLKLDTDKADPKIRFTGYDVDNFADQQELEPLPAGTGLSGQGYLEWPEGSEQTQQDSNPLGFGAGSESTSITVTGLGVSPEMSRKVRVYFKAVEEGAAEIKMQAIGETVLNESFAFQAERNKPLLVTIEPREIAVGEDFTVKVLDAEDGTEKQEATVQVKDSKGKLVASLAGRGSTRRGLRGEYFFKNNLEPGLYNIVVSVAGYKSLETELAIARHNLLSAHSPITIDISKAAREKTFSFSIRNDAKQDIAGIGYQLEKDADFPEEFGVSVVLPGSVSKQQDVTGTIRVLVNLNEDSEDNLYGEADLVLSGMVAGNYPTKTKIRLRISYNKALEEDCLYFDKQHLVARVVGRPGSTATEEFEAENRCNVALNLNAGVEALQEDPMLTVTVSPLRIEKDEVKKVKVTISNRVERMNSLVSQRDYRLKFESSQIAKTIPLTVELVNPGMSLSYPPSLSLWMVRSAAQDLAYAQTPIQILNRGPLPVTAFGVAVTPEAYMQGITAGIKPTRVTGMALGPGMPLTPQRFVYAQTSRTDAMQRPGQGWIEFTGVVGGRQQSLGRAALSVNYSGTKCLKVSPVDSMVFSSKEASQGTLERTIKIKNECGEPVRLSGKMKPEKVSGNSFVISPPITLNPGQEQSVKLILIKGQEASSTATMKVIGLLTNQNQWIESNELSVTLKLGELAATAEGKATAAISMKECNTDATTEMAFPILSSDCSAGYCDAKQLAEYLVAKADNLVKTAQDKARRAKNNAANFGNCAQNNYCDFGQMGIIPEPFPVYQQLDFMTEQVLENAFKEKSKTELKSNYYITQGSKSVEEIGSAGFDFGQINLGGNFKGCGKYYVEIVGAVRVSGSEIMIEPGTRNFMLSINILQDKATTEECQHRIQNVSNFLPVDEGFTTQRNFHAWPGFVKAGSEFGGLAKEFANELFGKAEGRYSATISATSNKIEIVKGNTGGGLLKIGIEKQGKSDQPKTIYAYVPSYYSETDKEMKEGIAKAFSNFKRNAFDDACWGKDEKDEYIVMKSYLDLEKLYGKLQLQGEKAIRVNNQRQCIDLNISSKVGEKAWFSTDFLTRKDKVREGIEYIEIVDQKGKVLLKESANGTGEKVSKKEELLLKKVERPGAAGSELYNAGFKFCVKGSERFPLAVENVKAITITGHGTGTKELDRKTEPYPIAIEACGMHPYDLVKKMGSVQLKEIEGKEEKKLVSYVTVSWKGSPEDIDITAVQRAVAADAAMDEARQRYGAGTNIPEAEQPAYMSEIAWRRAGGVGSYLAGCTVVSVAGSVLKLGWGGVLDWSLDCGVPALWAARKIAKDSSGPVKEIVNGVEEVIRRLIPFVSDETNVDIGMPTEAELQERGQDFWENIGTPAVFGVGADSIRLAVKNGGMAITETSADIAGKDVAKRVFGKLRETTFKGVTDGDALTTLDLLEEGYAENIKKNLLQAKAVDPQNVKLIDNALVSSSQKAYRETGENVADFVLENAEKFGDPTKKAFAGVKKSALDNLFDETRAVSNSKFGIMSGDLEIIDVTKTKLPGEMAAMKTRVVDKMTDNIISDLQDQSPEFKKALEDTTFKRRVETNIKNTLETSIEPKPTLDSQVVSTKTQMRQYNTRGAKIDPADLDNAAKHAIVKVKRNLGDELVEKTLGKKVSGELVDKIMKGDPEKGLLGIDNFVNPKTGATRWSRLKTGVKQWKSFFTLSTFKSLAKGVAGGVLANWVGYQAWKYYWEKYGEAPVPGKERTKTTNISCIDRDGDGKCNEDPINGIDDDKDGNIDEDYPLLAEQSLERGQTYRLEITADEWGKLYNFSKLQTEEDFEAMKQELKDNKAVLWEEKGCNNFLKKGMSQYLGNLAPVPSKSVKPEHVISYYNYNSIFVDAAKGESTSGDDLQEENLVSVLIVKPEIIPNCEIPKEWYKRNQGETMENAKSRAENHIKCAAKELRAAMGRAGAGASFRKVAEALVSGQEKTGKYIELAVQAQKQWEKFRIVRAS